MCWGKPCGPRCFRVLCLSWDEDQASAVVLPGRPLGPSFCAASWETAPDSLLILFPEAASGRMLALSQWATLRNQLVSFTQIDPMAVLLGICLKK